MTTKTTTTATTTLVPVPVFLLSLALAACGPMAQPTHDASTPPGSDSATTAPDSPITPPPPGPDGSTTPPVDSAVTPPSDGSVTPPPADAGEVPEGTVRVSNSCPTFTPCGGDPAGAWRYTDVCLAPPVDSLRAMCPGLEVTGSGTVRGAVTFAAGTVTRNVSGTYRIMMMVPATCAVVGCGVIQSALRASGYPDATCTASASRGCDCTANGAYSSNEATTYTVAGNTIRTGSGGTYDFCASGGGLTYRQTGPASGGEPWIAQMTRR